MKYIQANSPETDIIFITAAAEIDIVKKAFRGGVADYILKPLTFDRFKDSLLTYKEKRDSLIGTLEIILPFITFICNAGPLVMNLI